MAFTGLYNYAERLIHSALPLSELSTPPFVASQLDKAAIGITLLEAPPSQPADSDWLHHWHSGSARWGDVSLALSCDGERFLLRFWGLADFSISGDGRQIDAWPAPSTQPETLRHLLLDHVLPRVLAHQGRTVLHAGGVQVGDGAIAFVGSSGSGKSTLAASFHAAGFALLCDDGLVLQQDGDAILAVPTYPSLRLWPQSIESLYRKAPALASMAHYSSKQRIVLEDVPNRARLPLTSVYVLEPSECAEISLQRLSPQEACMSIIRHSFQLHVTDRTRLANAFVEASRLAAHLPVFSLSYPRDFARLPEVHDAIGATVAKMQMAS